MNALKINKIQGIETLADEALVTTLKDCCPTHKVGCVNWEEFPYTPDVNFRIACSDKALVLMFEVKEDHVRAEAMEDNGPVWEDSCVEFFVMSPDGKHYTNFEMNCIGTLLAAFRTGRHDAEHFDIGKMSQIRRITSLPHAKTDSSAEGQTWWAVEVIPFSLMGYETAPAKLKANIYKCGDKCSRPHFLSWSPIALAQPDFHCPDFFGEMTIA